LRASPISQCHRFVAAFGEILGHPLQLAAEHRLQPGTELGERVSGANGQPEHFAAHALDVPARDVVGGHDQHGRALLLERNGNGR
jgi:hypothetical protein